MSDKFPRIEDRGEYVILRGELGGDVVHDVAWSETPGIDAFNEWFELDKTDYLGDPNDSFYQVITFTRIIKRRTDGRLFGYQYSKSPGNDGMEGDDDQDLEALSERLGFDIEWTPDYDYVGGQPYVFLPVEKFERIGYTVQQIEGDDDDN